VQAAKSAQAEMAKTARAQPCSGRDAAAVESAQTLSPFADDIRSSAARMTSGAPKVAEERTENAQVQQRMSVDMGRSADERKRKLCCLKEDFVEGLIDEATYRSVVEKLYN
jgi:5-carboxymethyl-2-hydroxymuconate isomerase